MLLKPGDNSCVCQSQLGPEKEEGSLAGKAAMCTESVSYLFWFWLSLSCYTLHYVAYIRHILLYRNIQKFSFREVPVNILWREDERERAGEPYIRFPLEGCKSHGYELDRYLQVGPDRAEQSINAIQVIYRRTVLEHSQCLEMDLIYSQARTFALFTTSHLQGNVPPLN